MAKVEIAFIGSGKSGADNVKLSVYLNLQNEILLRISSVSNDSDSEYITLDVETAIQLVKEMKKCIGYSKQLNKS